MPEPQQTTIYFHKTAQFEPEEKFLCILSDKELAEIEQEKAKRRLASKPKPKPIETTQDTKKIEEYITAISADVISRYTEYWTTITPSNHEQTFGRWVFSFLSVHTSWQANLRAYKILDKDKHDYTEKDKLRNLIVSSRVGLDNMRTEGIWKFKQEFWNDPEVWYKKDSETWDEFRDRTMKKCHGLGYAKTSFAVELCYPTTCQLTCLDTHMLQLYGVKSSPGPSPSKYKELEKHWVDTCNRKGYPPFMVRNIYWDKVQEQKDTRYWSAVFEETKIEEKLLTANEALATV